MAERLNRDDEDRILGALDRAVDDVQAGTSPDDAIVKAAGDANLPAGHIRLMVHAFNRGRANTQRKSGETVFDKAASVSLADAEKVIDRLFRQPVREKVASAGKPRRQISEEYSQPPSWQSDPRLSGQPLLPEPDTTPRPRGAWDKRASIELGQLDRQVAELRQQAFCAGEKAASALHELEVHFRKEGQAWFDACRQQATAGYGQAGARLFDAIADSMKGLRKSASTGRIAIVNRTQAPWIHVERFLKEAALRQQRLSEVKQLTEHPDVVQLRARTPAGEASRVIKSAAEPTGSPSALKARAFGSRVGGGFFGGMQNAIGMMASPIGASWDKMKIPEMDNSGSRAALQEEQYQKLTDPVHELHVQQIQTKAVLSDLLANDPIISGYDPEEVLQHFNDLQRLAPRAASQPALLRALLRKQLGQGQLDTHDLSQVADIEVQLHKGRSPGSSGEVARRSAGK